MEPQNTLNHTLNTSQNPFLLLGRERRGCIIFGCIHLLPVTLAGKMQQQEPQIWCAEKTIWKVLSKLKMCYFIQFYAAEQTLEFLVVFLTESTPADLMPLWQTISYCTGPDRWSSWGCFRCPDTAEQLTEPVCLLTTLHSHLLPVTTVLQLLNLILQIECYWEAPRQLQSPRECLCGVFGIGHLLLSSISDWIDDSAIFYGFFGRCNTASLFVLWQTVICCTGLNVGDFWGIAVSQHSRNQLLSRYAFPWSCTVIWSQSLLNFSSCTSSCEHHFPRGIQRSSLWL